MMNLTHKPWRRGQSSRIAAIAAAFCLGTAAQAHPSVPTVVDISVDTRGELHLAVAHDVLAWATQQSSDAAEDSQMLRQVNEPDPRLDSILAASGQRLMEQMDLLVDGSRIQMSALSFPTTRQVRAWASEHNGNALSCVLECTMRARLPEGARDLQIRLPELLGGSFLSVVRPGLERAMLPVDAGDLSPPLDISMATHARADDVSAARRGGALMFTLWSLLPCTCAAIVAVRRRTHRAHECTVS
jgi:hypothetical protein